MTALTPYWSDDACTLYLGDCLIVLAGMPDESVDAIVCDPPYGLANLPPQLVTAALTAWLAGDREHVPDGRGFMGRAWDAFVPPPAVWDQCARILKPGGHLLAFAGSRTVDLMTLSIRLAGFEIRDGIEWIYGSGFPKGTDMSKAIDKAAGHWRGRAGALASANGSMSSGNYERTDKGDPVTAAAAATAWHGWNTSLKPAHEPIVLARKSMPGTAASNVLEHGTGALNVDGCRVPGERITTTNGSRNEIFGDLTYNAGEPWQSHDAGRWPTNVIFTHGKMCAEVCVDDCPVVELNRRSGMGHEGGASRFFPAFRYQAKAGTAERPRLEDGTAHTTVKPLDLMAWLVRLVTPPGGLVLDPFAGSGTTGEACLIEGFRCVLVEREQPHANLIVKRLSKPIQPGLFG